MDVKTAAAPALGCLLTLVPALAAAHPNLMHMAGFADGFMHPLTGIDHTLAMLAVGLLAARSGKHGVWLVPAAFVSMMLAGALAAVPGNSSALVEMLIALSVVAFGAALVARRTFGVIAAATLAGFFALSHGYAHGQEMPAAAFTPYVLGFTVATAALHAAGALAAVMLMRRSSAGHGALRFAGALLAAAGIGLLAGMG